MVAKATEGVIDFTNVKEGGGNFNKKRQPEGDYRAKIMNVVDSPAKKDNMPQWLFTIQVGSGTYAYYCKHEENQFWKIRNLLVAAGMTVPKKKVKVDPNKLVGKSIAVTLEDDEYDGKAQSNIAATFPLSELDDDGVPDEDEDNAADDGDDDAEEEAPVAKKKAAPPAEEEDDEDDDGGTADPLAALDRTALKALIGTEALEVRVTKSMTDDDIRAAIGAARKAGPTVADDEEDDDEEPTPPPAKTKKKAAPVVADDDDLEEIDIDDT